MLVPKRAVRVRIPPSPPTPSLTARSLPVRLVSLLDAALAASAPNPTLRHTKSSFLRFLWSGSRDDFSPPFDDLRERSSSSTTPRCPSLTTSEVSRSQNVKRRKSMNPRFRDLAFCPSAAVFVCSPQTLEFQTGVVALRCIEDQKRCRECAPEMISAYSTATHSWQRSHYESRWTTRI